MLSVAPMSVLLMGLLGLLVIAFGTVRMTMLELRARRDVMLPARLVTPIAPISPAAPQRTTV